jgi:hypothetical protein
VGVYIKLIRSVKHECKANSLVVNIIASEGKRLLANLAVANIVLMLTLMLMIDCLAGLSVDARHMLD